MKQYIVIALYVGAASGKILNSGDIVNADAWPDGVAESLEEQGFIKEHVEGEEPKKEVVIEPPSFNPDAVLDETIPGVAESLETKEVAGVVKSDPLNPPEFPNDRVEPTKEDKKANKK